MAPRRPASSVRRPVSAAVPSLALLLVVVVVLGLACRPTPPEKPAERLRWPEGATEVFDRNRLLGEREVARWTAEESAALLGGGLGVDLAAEDVDRLELRIAPPVTFPILAWSVAEGEGAESGRGRIHGRPIAPGSRVFRFELSDQLAWRGRIRSLALEPAAFAATAKVATEGPGARPLGGLRAVGRTMDPVALALAVPQPWKVDLGFELRDARLAPPGVPIEWQPDGGAALEGRRFVIGYGLEKGVREAVDFRIVAHPAAVELFTARLSPTEAGRWHRAVVEVPSRDAVERLSFETHVVRWEGTPGVQAVGGEEPPLRLERGFPIWGGVEEVVPEPHAGGAPNVILISIDTLRSDHLELYGHDHDTAPHLTAWARQRGVVFENAIAPSPWTLPSHVSMLTGRDAMAHGVYTDRPAPATLETLAEILRARGYRTAAITGGGYLNPSFGLAQGFDTYRYWAAAEGEIESGSEHLEHWLEQEAGEPFFLFFHTYEVHSPFRARPPHFERLGGDPAVDPADWVDIENQPMTAEGLFQLRKGLVRVAAEGARTPLENEGRAGIDELHRRYDSGISHVDALLAPLWQRLTTTDLGERTLVIFTSDHGEALGERGLGGHAYLWDFNLRIPLVVGLPGGRGAGLRVAQQVRTIDLVPTVLDALGLPIPGKVDGASLLPLVDAGGEPVDDFPAEAWSYAASSNYGVALRRANRRGSLKYIYNDTAFHPALGRAELYDLETDPDETSELLTDGGEETERLRQRVLETLRQRAQGLEIVFHAPGPDALVGRLAGGSIQVMRVKSWGEGCRKCFGFRAGTLEFDVAAGEEGQVVLLAVGTAEALELELELGGSGETPWRTTVDTGVLGEGLDLRLGHDGEPSLVPSSDAEASPHLRFRWLGGAGSAEEETLEVEDPRLREQLEALGYLDG